MERPPMRIAGPVINSDDPVRLGEFYARFLGWRIVEREGPRPGHPSTDGWVKLRSPDEAWKIEIQWEEDYRPPVWPSASAEQQMLMHLDVAVEDLDAGVAWAVECGAMVAEHQPQEDVRVMLDPSGHPFCLFPSPVDW